MFALGTGSQVRSSADRVKLCFEGVNNWEAGRGWRRRISLLAVCTGIQGKRDVSEMLCSGPCPKTKGIFHKTTILADACCASDPRRGLGFVSRLAKGQP